MASIGGLGNMSYMLLHCLFLLIYFYINLGEIIYFFICVLMHVLLFVLLSMLRKGEISMEVMKDFDFYHRTVVRHKVKWRTINIAWNGLLLL